MRIKVVTWNVLADCYSIGQSTKDLSILEWTYRKNHIERFVTASKADILCLQEIDHYKDFYEPFLKNIGMSSIYMQRPNRDDGCLIAYKNHFTCLEYKGVEFDDLGKYTDPSQSSSSYYDRFIRNNVAIMARLSLSDVPDLQFVTTCGHIYWNPAKPEVKLAQTVYWMDCLRKFASYKVETETRLLPSIVCGDFNSMPDSDPYKYMTNGIRIFPDSISSLDYVRQYTDTSYGSQVKFLCDSTLSRLCRWMRALGIDVAIDRVEGPRTVTKDFTSFFDRARRENRVILTTSKIMRQRANCPRSTHVNTKHLEQSLVDICREYSIKLDKERLLTVCGKCGGEIESCTHEDERFAGKFLPEDRPVFICTDCSQPYWWNDREDSSPARAMKVADRLYGYISEQLKQDAPSRSFDKSDEEDGPDRHVSSSQESIYANDEEGNAVTSSAERDDTDDIQKTNLSELFDLRNKSLSMRSEIDASRGSLMDSSTADHSKNDDPNPSSTDEAKTNTWHFNSVFQALHRQEPECTNWSGDFFGTLDYIFASSDWGILDAAIHPKVVRDIQTKSDAMASEASHTEDGGKTIAIESVDLDSFLAEQSLPSRIWSSDHFMLTTILEME